MAVHNILLTAEAMTSCDLFHGFAKIRKKQNISLDIDTTGEVSRTTPFIQYCLEYC